MQNIIKFIPPNIVYNKFIGDQGPEVMKELIGENQKITRDLNFKKIKPNFLGDISEIGELGYEARKMAVDSFRNSTKYEKVAIVGASRLYRYLITFMSAGLASFGHVKLFENESEAMHWLNS